MNPYFLAIIVIQCLGLGLTLAKHGESQGDYNIFISAPVAGIVLWLIHSAIHWTP